MPLAYHLSQRSPTLGMRRGLDVRQCRGDTGLKGKGHREGHDLGLRAGC